MVFFVHSNYTNALKIFSPFRHLTHSCTSSSAPRCSSFLGCCQRHVAYVQLCVCEVVYACMHTQTCSEYNSTTSRAFCKTHSGHVGGQAICAAAWALIFWEFRGLPIYIAVICQTLQINGKCDVPNFYRHISTMVLLLGLLFFFLAFTRL